jgi:hypothetical protein
MKIPEPKSIDDHTVAGNRGLARLAATGQRGAWLLTRIASCMALSPLSSTPKTQKTKDIFLPNAKVFLVPFNDLTHPVASTVTDLSGRFALKTKKTGTFSICIEADGFPRVCPKSQFRLFNTSEYLGTLRIPTPRREKSATAFGEVTMGDGSHPRSFEPFLGVNAFGMVETDYGKFFIQAHIQ